MKTKKQLENELAKIRGEIWKIEDAESLKRSKSCLGKLYKFHNSIGGDHKRWWVYLAVCGLSEHGNLKTWSFQKTPYHHEIENGKHPAWLLLDGSWKEISKLEFHRAWVAFHEEIETKSEEVLK